MSDRIPLFINLGAGRRRTDRLARRAAAAGLDPLPTTGASDLARRLRDLTRAGAERVAVAGGDGTVHAAIQALAGTATALAIIPAGTGNDAARALGVPLDLDRSLERARRGDTRRVDLGRADGRRFVGVLGIGVDSATNRVAERLRRRGLPRGPWVYPLAGLLALARFEPPAIRLSTDGGAPRPRIVTLLAVANGPCFGGGMRIAPGARLDDGLLDVVTVASAPALRLALLLGAVYRGRHVRSPLVDVVRAAQVRVALATPQPLQLDGEVVEATADEVVAVCEPGALTVVA